ncbi:MAG: tetratricopeptide repeat protein [Candidatus Eremiobacteraeota bacterium]|nr:tetratricopeptide repeat protein [Candidatus Eremiobacteraeota bacterium]
MNQPLRFLTITGFAAVAFLAGAGGVFGAPKPAATSAAAAAASASPAPLPTATPEDPKVAIPRLEAKIKANPDDRESLQMLAPYYMETGQADKALALTQRLLGLGVKNANIYYLDGFANQQLNRIKEATADFEQAANLEPTNAQVLLTLTNLYLSTNRPADAERVAKRATTFNPNDKQAFENFGLVLAQEKKYNQAREQFEAAAKLDPKDPQPIILQARSYIDEKALAIAAQLYDRALALDPKSVEGLIGKARLLATGHNVKEAQAVYDTLTPLLPNDAARAQLLVEETQMYRAEKLDSDAEATIKKALASYGDNPAVHLAYGDYLLSKKNEAGAETEWKTALGPKRDSADALQRLGNLALAQNKTQPAVEYFGRLTELVPNDASVWGQDGQVLSFAKQYDKSRDAYRRCFELSRSPECLSSMAATDFELKNYKECSQIFDAIEKNAGGFLKSNPQFYLLAGRCYGSAGQRDKARAEFVKLQPLVKPGSQQAKDLAKLIADVSAKPAPKPAPKPTASPKR